MAKKNDQTRVPRRCSFCGKPAGQVRRLFSGYESFICDECVELCSDLLQSAPETGVQQEIAKIPPPAEIKNFLDQYVIGQEQAKKTVSVAVYNHYKRINAQAKAHLIDDDVKADVELEKSNILLLGPTGTGKTLLARTLARFLKVPFTIADATVLTEAGYVGEDVENILVRLYQAAHFNQLQTERGIIYIDELDKISRKEGNPSITRDVSGEGVQQGLLKILEGTVANIPPKGGRKHPEQAFVQINTSNILFICGGAFDGLEQVVGRRIGKKTMGFEAEQRYVKTDSAEILEHVLPVDLISYGLIPELVGRLPVAAPLIDLDEAALMNILTQPKNALTKQYAKLFEMEGVKLRFDQKALKAAVKIAMERKTGARALRSILEKAMMDIMYEVPSNPEVAEVVINAKTITDGAKPKIITHAKKKKAG
ncbi:MAG: ATP-dependent Clp protease ATP-binding subunit ClpX [candidate division Zixibacteria bacterium]|nr:ATP-dependent Clp protease ATP-binding subunit ClpX [candidate division Zixibacteria bacterium]MDH3937003.1 ATP-dependent Clp protease ATP-binding subunit ClpX [candidate division Zixibacteria bacterium]